MLVTKVKICGITTYEDAVTATELGTDLLGFNFFSGSPRFVDVEKAAAIARQLPAFVELAGVFVDASIQTIRQAVAACHLDWVQLHGNESPVFCQSLASDSVKIIKALRVKDKADLDRADAYPVDAMLLDAFHPDQYGGTGLTFDWGMIQNVERRFFLAGGITPENAPKAISLGVYGIDVCSGVESQPGKKDPAKMKALFDNIRYLRG